MCMVDEGDGAVTVLRSLTRKAKKAHQCKECGRFIEPPEIYDVTVYEFEGKVEAHKTCGHCAVVRNWLEDECGGFLYCGIEEDAREHCSEGLYGMDLFRAVVGMSWNWRTKSGRLLPVPAPIKTSDEVKRMREARGG